MPGQAEACPSEQGCVPAPPGTAASVPCSLSPAISSILSQQGGEGLPGERGQLKITEGAAREGHGDGK